MNNGKGSKLVSRMIGKAQNTFVRHQEGFLKTETTPSKPKEPFLLHYPHTCASLPKCREPVKIEKTQGLLAKRLKDCQSFYRMQRGYKKQLQEKIFCCSCG